MWYILDLKDKQEDERVLGRLATRIAKVLIGKHKPSFEPHKPGDDYVIVTHADMIEVTGGKEEKKEYISHTKHLGSLKFTKYKDVFAASPADVLERAVYGMLPKNKLRDLRMARFKVYAGETHPHTAQTPVIFPEV